MSDDNNIYNADQFDFPEENRIIKVIGVGGGGCNAVDYMYKQNIANVDYVLVNSDMGALKKNAVPTKLVIGYELTHGLGAGNDPVVGRQCAELSADDLRKLFEPPTEMVFITAGMGGGTGTGAGPVVAQLAKEAGMLTIGIVTVPFAFEGEAKIVKAINGAEKMKEHVDALLVINNENIISLYKDYSLFNAFSKADDTLANAARSISEIISEDLYINVDFRDVKTVLTNAGTAIISTAYGEGEYRISEAIENALHSPLLKRHDIKTAKRLLLKIVASKDTDNPMQASEINEIKNFTAQLPKTIDVKWGMGEDPSLGDKVKVTILAAGFDVTLREATGTLPESEIIFPAAEDSDSQIQASVVRDTVVSPGNQESNTSKQIADVYGEEMIWENTLSSNKAIYAVLRPDHFDDDEIIRRLEREPALRRSRDFLNTLNAKTGAKTNVIQRPENVAPADSGTIKFT